MLLLLEGAIGVLPNRAVLVGVDDDGPLNNVGQSENVQLRGFSKALLSFLPVRKLLQTERQRDRILVD